MTKLAEMGKQTRTPVHMLANEETGANFKSASEAHAEERQRQLEKQANRYRDLENTVHDLENMTRLVSHYMGLLLEDAGAFDLKTMNVSLPTETALVIDWATTTLSRMAKDMRDNYIE